MTSLFRRILTPPVFEDEHKTRIANPLNAILIALSIISVAVLIWILIPNGIPNEFAGLFLLFTCATVGFICMGLLILLRRGHVKLTGIIISCVIWVVITSWIYSAGVTQDSTITGYFLVIIIAGLILGERAVMIFSASSITAVVGAYYGQKYGIIGPPVQDPDPFWLIMFIIFIGVASLLLSISVRTTTHTFLRTQQTEKALRKSNLRLKMQTKELVKRKKELMESEERFRTLFEASPEAIILIGLDGIIIDCNEIATKISGMRKDEFIGRSFTDITFFDRKDTKKIVELFSMAIRGDDLGTIDMMIHVGNDKKWIEVFPALLKKKRTVYAFQLIIRDITERKETEEKLKKTMNALKRSNTELEQLMTVASHDLQEPQRMVVSYLQLLESRYKGKLDTEADEFINFAVSGATKMKLLVNDLVTYLNIGANEISFKPMPLEFILKKALSNLQNPIKINEAVVTHTTLPTISIDERQFKLLFQNMVDNSIKFRGKQSPRIHVAAQSSESEWIFSIKDNGIGIDPKYKDKIFTIFRRLHGGEAYPGTGVGLAICKKIVEHHGGRIWVESEPGRGSVFYFTIPKNEVKDDNEKQKRE